MSFQHICPIWLSNGTAHIFFFLPAALTFMDCCFAYQDTFSHDYRVFQYITYIPKSGPSLKWQNLNYLIVLTTNHWSGYKHKN